MMPIVRTLLPFSQSDASRAAHGRGEAHQQKFCGALWLSGHLPLSEARGLRSACPRYGHALRGAFGLIPRELRAATHVRTGLKAAICASQYATCSEAGFHGKLTLPNCQQRLTRHRTTERAENPVIQGVNLCAGNPARLVNEGCFKLLDLPRQRVYLPPVPLSGTAKWEARITRDLDRTTSTISCGTRSKGVEKGGQSWPRKLLAP